MLYTSTPLNKNINNNNEEEKNGINKSEININKNPLSIKSKNIDINETNSIQIINPFDSITSKSNQFQFQTFSNNNPNKINNRYSQVSNSISLSNSNSHTNKDNNNDFSARYKQYNNFSYTSSNMTNRDINANNTHLNNGSKNEKSINESNDIKFEIINNDEASNYKNNNNKSFSSSSFSNCNSNYSINNNNFVKKNEQFNAIKEIDEEEFNDADINQDFLSKINLNDLESYVSRYKPIKNSTNKEYTLKNNYEIKKRISDIINNSPFGNIHMKINEKNCEVIIDKLLTVSNIVYIKSLNNEQITEQFNKNFYEQILSARKFSNLNAGLHNSINNDSSLISIGQLHTYNGYNKDLNGKKTRDVIDSNGNSFIKGFIFNYFENIILDMNLDNIIFIIYIISTKLPLLKITDINLQEVLTIIKIIFTHLEKKNILQAYTVLINAFKENSSFEKGLIYFVKFCLKQFIIDNYILFNIVHLNEIISKKYINVLNNQFDYQNYIQEKIIISEDGIKYEVLIYYILPLIFPINLILYTNNKSKNNKFIFKNRTNIENNNNNNNIYDIQLNIKFGNTSIIYDESYYNKYKDLLPYTNEFNYPVDKIQKIKNNNNSLCQECNLCPDNYIQVGPKIKPLCEKCFLDSINKVINKRFALFKEDSFFYEEYYCSKIKLTNAQENNLYLSLNDSKILMPNHTDISDEIHNLIINQITCDICNQNFISSKYSICLYPCGHLLCDKCFIKFISNITHKRTILNKFEIKTENFEYICPVNNCQNNRIKNNINDFIFKYIDGVGQCVKKAGERMETQAKNFCCVCKKINNKYYFDTVVNKNNNRKNLKHCLCNECKKNLDLQKKNGLKRNHQTKFMCEFCDEYHIYNALNIEKNKNKEKNESCCNIF